jgi:hypothetical protein
MENNPNALIARIAKDFPAAKGLNEKRVPPK